MKLQESEWTSVTDAVPSSPEVLAWKLTREGSFQHGECIVASYDDEENKWYFDWSGREIDVTHWMELPERPPTPAEFQENN